MHDEYYDPDAHDAEMERRHEYPERHHKAPRAFASLCARRGFRSWRVDLDTPAEPLPERDASIERREWALMTPAQQEEAVRAQNHGGQRGAA